MKYGGFELAGKFVLGPMAAYTDMAFRLLCRKRGAAMCFTEFSNANAIVRGGAESWKLMQTSPDEMPVGIQIFGESAAVMAHAASAISEKVSSGELAASCIDINFGCPAGTVIRAGAGSALLKNPQKIGEIVAACVKASSVPITAKIRSGWNSDSAVALAKVIEDAGASGITVHWRTATEGRKRASGWESVGGVKRAVGIPVIGNGGASSPQKAVALLRETGCDAVMVSSGALGNPGIFARANALLEGKEAAPASWEEKKEDFLEYCVLAEKSGIASPKSLRAHAIEFVSGFEGVKLVRKSLNAAKSAEEIIRTMGDFAPPTPAPR